MSSPKGDFCPVHPRAGVPGTVQHDRLGWQRLGRGCLATALRGGRMRRNGLTGMATIPDVAKQAGVSTATAARALGGYGSVSAATSKRVLDAAATLGYRRNSFAS